MSYDSKPNYMLQKNVRLRYSNRTVTLIEHPAMFITYSIKELYYIASYSVGSSATNS